jgi:hypothetical protein
MVMIDELERIWKEACMICSSHLTGGIEENHKKIVSQGSQEPGQDTK